MATGSSHIPTEPGSSLRHLQWKVGSESPPFLMTNTWAAELLKCILDGTIDRVPVVTISSLPLRARIASVASILPSRTGDMHA